MNSPSFRVDEGAKKKIIPLLLGLTNERKKISPLLLEGVPEGAKN